MRDKEFDFVGSEEDLAEELLAIFAERSAPNAGFASQLDRKILDASLWPSLSPDELDGVVYEQLGTTTPWESLMLLGALAFVTLKAPKAIAGRDLLKAILESEHTKWSSDREFFQKVKTAATQEEATCLIQWSRWLEASCYDGTIELDMSGSKDLRTALQSVFHL